MHGTPVEKHCYVDSDSLCAGVIIICMKLIGWVLCLSGLDDDMKVDVEERNGNKSDSDSDDTSSRRTTTMENGYLQPVETAYVENSVEELGQVCHCQMMSFTSFVLPV